MLGGTAGPLSLPLLDGDEIVEEHSIVPTVPESLVEDVVADPRLS